MENRHKNNKVKSNKLKINNKKVISAKNSFFNIKTSSKTSHNNNNNIISNNSPLIKTKKLIINNNLHKYNTSITKYNVYIINAIIFDQRNHIVTLFKNYLLWDETSEFLKRYYRKKDNSSRLPKIAEYYEKYTLITPNYFGNEGLIIIIMIKFMKRKKKYFKYLEEKEDEEDKIKKNNNKDINKDFEPLIKNEIFTKTKTKSLFSSYLDISKNTLELTNYENDSIYLNKIETKRKNTNKEININKLDICKDKIYNNSMSFTEIFDDLSSHFSILINNNGYQNYIQKSKKIPIKSFVNKTNIIKKGINPKNNFKKLDIKHIKSLSRKDTPNKLQNESKNENNNLKSKEMHKTSKYKKKINVKKISSAKEQKIKEKEKIDINSEKENKIINKDVRKHLAINIFKQKENKDYNLSKNIIIKKNINIVNNNYSKNSKIIKNEDKENIMNTITNIQSKYYSLGKLIKNKKQRSAIKKVNIKSLNLVNFNQNIIPNLKKIVNKKKDRRIIFPRNNNYMYNNNTNKLNSIKGDNFEHIKLLTDRDKDTLINNTNNTNEGSKLIKLNDNMFLNNNQNNNYIINHKRQRVDVFAHKVGKLIKKKNISLFGDNNLSSKDNSNRNSLLYKNEKKENMAMSNVNNINNMHYKKNSVLRQFNSKKDFNFNNKNNIFYNYNNVSNNSINSSSSSSLNNLNKKKYKLSNNAISQNNSINKNRKSLQKINLNLNLQINFNINIDKKNKKLILAKRINNRIFNEINNKNKIQNSKYNNNINNNNSNNYIKEPNSQRCYYNINNKGYKFLGCRSSSSSNSKKKKKGKLVI